MSGPGETLCSTLNHPGTVSFDTLTEAFGPESLGIIVVKDLPQTFTELRAKVLSNASHLAALSDAELGKCVVDASPTHPQHKNRS